MSAICTCGAEIIWARHAASGSRMPLEAARSTTGLRYTLERDQDGVTARHVETEGAPGHRSHFASCPDSQQHRRGHQTRA